MFILSVDFSFEKAIQPNFIKIIKGFKEKRRDSGEPVGTMVLGTSAGEEEEFTLLSGAGGGGGGDIGAWTCSSVAMDTQDFLRD